MKIAEFVSIRGSDDFPIQTFEMLPFYIRKEMQLKKK